MAQEWYIRVMGESIGPVAPTEMREMVKAGRITIDDEVRCGVNGRWVPAGEVKGLFDNNNESDPFDDVAISALGGANRASARVAEQRDTTLCPFCREEISRGARKCQHCGEYLDSALREARVTAASGDTRKSKAVVLALILFLGGALGFHRLYAGKTASGIVMLGIGITGAGLVKTLPWSLFDLFSVLTGSFKDGEGRDLV